MSRLRDVFAAAAVYALVLLATVFFSVCRLFGVEVDE